MRQIEKYCLFDKKNMSLSYGFSGIAKSVTFIIKFFLPIMIESLTLKIKKFEYSSDHLSYQFLKFLV